MNQNTQFCNHSPTATNHGGTGQIPLSHVLSKLDLRDTSLDLFLDDDSPPLDYSSSSVTAVRRFVGVVGPLCFGDALGVQGQAVNLTHGQLHCTGSAANPKAWTGRRLDNTNQPLVQVGGQHHFRYRDPLESDIMRPAFHIHQLITPFVNGQCWYSRPLELVTSMSLQDTYGELQEELNRHLKSFPASVALVRCDIPYYGPPNQDDYQEVAQQIAIEYFRSPWEMQWNCRVQSTPVAKDRPWYMSLEPKDEVAFEEPEIQSIIDSLLRVLLFSQEHDGLQPFDFDLVSLVTTNMSVDHQVSDTEMDIFTPQADNINLFFAAGLESGVSQRTLPPGAPSFQDIPDSLSSGFSSGLHHPHTQPFNAAVHALPTPFPPVPGLTSIRFSPSPPPLEPGSLINWSMSRPNDADADAGSLLVVPLASSLTLAQLQRGTSAQSLSDRTCLNCGKEFSRKSNMKAHLPRGGDNSSPHTHFTSDGPLDTSSGLLMDGDSPPQDYGESPVIDPVNYHVGVTGPFRFGDSQGHQGQVVNLTLGQLDCTRFAEDPLKWIGHRVENPDQLLVPVEDQHDRHRYPRDYLGSDIMRQAIYIHQMVDSAVNGTPDLYREFPGMVFFYFILAWIQDNVNEHLKLMPASIVLVRCDVPFYGLSERDGRRDVTEQVTFEYSRSPWGMKWSSRVRNTSIVKDRPWYLALGPEQKSVFDEPPLDSPSYAIPGLPSSGAQTSSLGSETPMDASVSITDDTDTDAGFLTQSSAAPTRRKRQRGTIIAATDVTNTTTNFRPSTSIIPTINVITTTTNLLPNADLACPLCRKTYSKKGNMLTHKKNYDAISPTVNFVHTGTLQAGLGIACVDHALRKIPKSDLPLTPNQGSSSSPVKTAHDYFCTITAVAFRDEGRGYEPTRFVVEKGFIKYLLQTDPNGDPNGSCSYEVTAEVDTRTEYFVHPSDFTQMEASPKSCQRLYQRAVQFLNGSCPSKCSSIKILPMYPPTVQNLKHATQFCKPLEDPITRVSCRVACFQNVFGSGVEQLKKYEVIELFCDRKGDWHLDDRHYAISVSVVEQVHPFERIDRSLKFVELHQDILDAHWVKSAFDIVLSEWDFQPLENIDTAAMSDDAAASVSCAASATSTSVTRPAVTPDTPPTDSNPAVSRSSKPKGPFACPVEGCSKVYAQSNNLTTHTNTAHSNTPQQQHQCDICKKRCSRADVLRRHKRTEHESTPNLFMEGYFPTTNYCSQTLTSTVIPSEPEFRIFMELTGPFPTGDRRGVRGPAYELSTGLLECTRIDEDPKRWIGLRQEKPDQHRIYADDERFPSDLNSAVVR
ncbi:hypothetical protein BGX29_004896 [Mortierella sp. GBA35]|nr:hypothetical protein BGX29_004896 [Mortierella sp. GBA35]